MTKTIFITGTGTDVGKTYVTGLILKKLRQMGTNPAYYKAAMSGNARDSHGQLIPGDAAFVKDISGISQPLGEMCPYIYETAVSPHLASRMEGNPVDTETVRRGFRSLCETYDSVTVEGSGGILCPIHWEQGRHVMLEDVISDLELSCLLVADAGLGTINSVVLTAEYMRSRNIPLKAILFNHWIQGDPMREDNLRMCEELTGLKVIAKVAHGDRDLNIDGDALLSLYDEQ